MAFTRRSTAIALSLAAALTLVACGKQEEKKAAAPAASAAKAEATKAAFVYISPIGDAGYTFQHDQARLSVEKALGASVATKFVDKVSENPADAERVFRTLAEEGNKVIFGTSFGYMEPMLKVAKDFPKTTFIHATGYKTAENMAQVNVRFYEGRYLAGIIAGKSTKTNVLGYAAAFPIPEVVQGINAFMRGAQSVNPKATMKVVWVNSWYDPGKEREAALTLLSQGADVITHHTDSNAVVQAAEEKGKLAIAYHSDMSKYGPKAQLAAVTHHWGEYYTNAVKQVQAGTWKTSETWCGIKEGCIKLEAINASVAADVKEMVSKAEADMKAGTLNAFAGPVVKADGKEVVAKGANMDDKGLNDMVYYVKGITSPFPAKK